MVFWWGCESYGPIRNSNVRRQSSESGGTGRQECPYWRGLYGLMDVRSGSQGAWFMGCMSYLDKVYVIH
jgi:hypothetical protein